MARTRDLVAISAILLAPLAALLLLAPGTPAVDVAPQAPVVPEPPALVAPPAPPAEPVAPAPAEPDNVEPTPIEPASETVATPAPVRDPGQAMLVYKDALVLHTGAPATWASGRLSLFAEAGYLRLSKPAPWDTLPEPARALQAARVVVYDSDGSSCIATVGAAKLQLEQIGDVFLDEFGFEPPADKAVLRAMAKRIFDERDDRLLLAAQRGQDGKPCHGEWARRADLPAPAVFGRRSLADAERADLVAAALAVVREQPEYAAMRAEYTEYTAAIADHERDDWPDWDTFVAGHFSVTEWDEVGGPRRIVTVELRRIPEACSAEFAGSLALFLEHRDGALVRLPQPGQFDITAVMDIDRDGTLEVVARSGSDFHALHADGPAATTFAEAFWISYFGCPC